MPRRKPPPEPEPRRNRGTGSVIWVPRRMRWRARTPTIDGQPGRETWHLTKDEAEAWIASESARDAESFDPHGTVGAYLRYWYLLRAPGWGPQTQRRYSYELDVLADLHRIPLARLRGDQIQAAQARLLTRKHMWRGEQVTLTRRYVYNVVSLLRRALADAVKWRIVSDNVAETVTLPVPEQSVTKAWTVDEIRTVLKKIVGHRFEAAYLLILWGGLRIGEVVSLRWDQIQDDGRVAFDQAEHTHLKGRPIGTTKRERQRETRLPLPVVARLREVRAAGPAPMAWPARPRRDVVYVYVVQRPDGDRWTPRQIRDDWNVLVGSLKVKALTPHGGRRSFGTAHMVAGTPLADLSTLMGHSSPWVTAQAYLGADQTRQQEAAARLWELLADPKTDAKGSDKGAEQS